MSSLTGAFLAVSIGILAGWACAASGDAKGSYAVQLEIPGASRPFEGTLVLATSPLDIPTRGAADLQLERDWLGIDEGAANSCFILEEPVLGDGEGPIVRVFEARLSPRGGISTPIEILRLADLGIRIVSLRVFSNVLGGELEIEVSGEVRPGRIFGERTGPPGTQRCVEAVERFRSSMEGQERPRPRASPDPS